MTSVAPAQVAAAVSDGRGSSHVERLDLTGARGWLRVESSAVCGTDVGLHLRGLKAPAVLGHHVLGTVEHIDDELAETLCVKEGMRVALEEYLGCGSCPECSAGQYRFCPRADLWTGGERVGMLPVDSGSGLHGGNAQYIELTDRHAAHPVPEHISIDMAAWTLPLANAVDWTIDNGGAGPGSRVVIIGPGYHGLACVAAARVAGADVDVIGLDRDHARLDLARDLGARSHTFDEAVNSLASEADGSIDLVVDTAGTEASIGLAVNVLGRGGTLVIAGLGGGSVALDSDHVVRKLLTVRGVRGRSPQAMQRSIELLAAGNTGLEAIPTHHVALRSVGDTLVAMADGAGPATPHVVVDPWLQPADARAHTPQHLQETHS